MNIKKELREKMRPLMDDYKKSMAVLERMKKLPDYYSKNDIEKQQAATKEALDRVNKEGKNSLRHTGQAFEGVTRSKVTR